MTWLPSTGTTTLVTTAPPDRHSMLAFGASVKVVAAATRRTPAGLGSGVPSGPAGESPTASETVGQPRIPSTRPESTTVYAVSALWNGEDAVATSESVPRTAPVSRT